MKIKKLHPDAVIPRYAHDGDAGFDLYATEDVIVEPGETVKVSTGLAVALPDGFELQVRPRSGVTLKTKLRVQLGTIDSNYRGDIGVIVDNISRDNWSNASRRLDNSYDESTRDKTRGYIIRKGDRIAQGVMNNVSRAYYTEVDDLGETERGMNGFGSTGVNVNG